MNKKKLLSNVITMTAVAVISSVAHGAMSIERQQELCNKSKQKKVWDEYHNVCVPQNACKKEQKNKENNKYAAHCTDVFNEIDMFTYDEYGKVSNLDDVIAAMNFYVSKRLGWSDKCDMAFLRYPLQREYETNFVGCKFGPHYLTFDLGSIIGVYDKVLAGKCYTFGGRDISYQISPTTKTSKMLCNGISKTHCSELNGEYITESNGYEVKWCLL